MHKPMPTFSNIHDKHTSTQVFTHKIMHRAHSQAGILISCILHRWHFSLFKASFWGCGEHIERWHAPSPNKVHLNYAYSGIAFWYACICVLCLFPQLWVVMRGSSACVHVRVVSGILLFSVISQFCMLSSCNLVFKNKFVNTTFTLLEKDSLD